MRRCQEIEVLLLIEKIERRGLDAHHFDEPADNLLGERLEVEPRHQRGGELRQGLIHVESLSE